MKDVVLMSGSAKFGEMPFLNNVGPCINYLQLSDLFPQGFHLFVRSGIRIKVFFLFMEIILYFNRNSFNTRKICD